MTTVGDLRYRTRLLWIACVTTTLAALHFVDHVLRGNMVQAEHLKPAWNHSGWPFEQQVTPFTISLIGVTAILVGGIIFTIRGQLWAGYWLAAAVILSALVTQVHLIPGVHQESPSEIYHSWVGHPWIGKLAVLNTFAIIACLLAMALNAYLVGRATRRWL